MLQGSLEVEPEDRRTGSELHPWHSHQSSLDGVEGKFESLLLSDHQCLHQSDELVAHRGLQGTPTSSTLCNMWKTTTLMLLALSSVVFQPWASASRSKLFSGTCGNASKT